MKTRKKAKERLCLDLIQIKPKRAELARMVVNLDTTLGDMQNAENLLNKIAGPKQKFELKPVWEKLDA